MRLNSYEERVIDPCSVWSLSGTKRASATIVTSNFWPERTGIGQVNTELARFLSERGVQVNVVTGHPYYPEWRIYPNYRRSLFRTELLGAIAIHRSWHWVIPNPGAVARIIHEVTLGLFALPNLIRQVRTSPVVFIVSPDLSFAFLASLVCRVLRRPFRLVVQDVMPDAAVELGMLSNKWVLRASRAMARSLYNRAESIRTLGDGMRRRIAILCSNPEKISVIPNAVNVTELAPSPESGKIFRKRFIPDGTFAVVHSGNMGQKQDLGVILDAASELRETPDVHFFVFGDGAARESFIADRDNRRLPNVSTFDFQEREMVPHMLYGADVVVISQSREVVDIVVPSKLQVALAAGAMIVAVCAEESETATIVRASRGGVVVPAGDGKALAQAILRIRDGLEDSSEFRRNAQRFATANYAEAALYGPIAESVAASTGSAASRSA